MRMLATFPRSKAASAGLAFGYTLLELLVVLAIMGMVAAMAAPPTLRFVESWRSDARFKDAARQFDRLPMHARRGGRAMVLASPADWPESMGPWPEGMSLLEPVRVESNGFCQGGRVQLDAWGLQREAKVTSPFCALVWQNNAP